jgi:hypothetical protein
MADLKCPNCARDFVRRVSRVGLGERLLSVFYVYPFKCQLCGYRFRFFQWGVRYFRVEEDRREYDRMEITFPVAFASEAGSGEGSLMNVSMGGCSFRTKASLPVGTILKLTLQVSSDIPAVVVDAGVVRSVRTGGVGVEFLQWQQSERERLQLFVRGMLIGRGGESTAAKSTETAPRLT